MMARRHLWHNTRYNTMYNNTVQYDTILQQEDTIQYNKARISKWMMPRRHLRQKRQQPIISFSPKAKLVTEYGNQNQNKLESNT